jgi:hypothetical protein
MAYTVVHKNVVVTTMDEQGQSQNDSTEFAWVAIYRQYPDGWKIECVASTER